MTTRFSKAARTLLVIGAFVVFGSVGAPSVAEARSYSYALIDTVITVNVDSSMDVVEKQWFLFDGRYNQGYRSIPLNGVDAIEVTGVFDGATGEAYSYSFSRLNKEDPESWGKYATYEEGGATHIEWYYNLADTSHEFHLAYTVYGAIAFYEDHDELYWNFFTDYDVPVQVAQAHITLPGEVTASSSTAYVSNDKGPTLSLVDTRTYSFAASGFGPKESATIAVGWQKGLVDESQYWRYFWSRNWPYPASAILLIASILFAIAHWYFMEKRNVGRGVIIAQYEPPKGLRPAMGELIVREQISKRTWPATIVDLATRGYLKIDEIPKKTHESWVFWLIACAVFAAMVVIALTTVEIPFWLALFVAFVFTFAVLATLVRVRLLPNVGGKDYTLTRTEKDASGLETFEIEFLDDLFLGGTWQFSTKELRKSQSLQRNMYTRMKLLEEKLYAETDLDTHAYARSLSNQKKGMQMLLGSGFLFVIALISVVGFADEYVPDFWFRYLLLILSAGVSFAIVWYTIKFEARLNKEGQVMREEWLGFRLYLKTAERHRVQNLTPELFEKFLPYAMIFGIEKKWARAFSSITIPEPSWYHGSTGVFVGEAGGGGFSATSFTAGFSASFASSFASSGASGASGGGGAGGGGGGGGGGGAS